MLFEGEILDYQFTGSDELSMHVPRPKMNILELKRQKTESGICFPY